MNLFLASFFAATKFLFREHFIQDQAGKTVTFIPTAAKVEEVTHFIDSAKQAFKDLGMEIEELDISQSAHAKIQDTIDRNDFIYMTGGNTLYLLQCLQMSGADLIIREAVLNGKPYIGESAGSIILADNIDYILSMEDSSKAPKLLSYTGMGLIPFYPLPHKDNQHFKEMVSDIELAFEQLPLVSINDDQAILVEQDQYQVL